MTKEEMIRADVLPEITCRGCGHDLVISQEDQSDGPTDEILLECSILDGNECVAGEWFRISDVVTT